MSRRLSLLVLTLFAFALCWGGIQAAVSQRGEPGKQTLVIGYPTSGINIAGNGSPAKRYTGILYVKVFAIRPKPADPSGDIPVVTAELGPSQRTVASLPLGEYEVHYSMRTGSELKTFIVRNVILRADRGMSLIVEMNEDAKTTVIGGDMTAQQMVESIRLLQKEVADLRQEISRLKQK